MNPARISLLLPTYRRPDQLRRTLVDVWASVARPELLELLLYVALEDDETIALFPMSDLPIMRGLTGPHVGYRGLPTAINMMAAASVGDWLFVFADDVGCNTPGWDDVIRRYDHTIPTLLTCENNSRIPMWFPVISRPAYAALTCVTRSQFHDVWLGEVFDRALPDNVHRAVPARFTDRIVAPLSLDGIGDEARRDFDRTVVEAADRLRAATVRVA